MTTVITAAQKLINVWDEIFSSGHKDTGYEYTRLEKAVNRLRNALKGDSNG